MLIRSFLILCSLITFVLAGPNADALLHFDFEPSTDAIDSEIGCPKDDDFTVAVAIEDAENLYAYEFYITFDTASLKLVSAKKGSNANPNFLEQNDGSTFFDAGISKNDSTRVKIGSTLTGDDENECASGAGILCLVTFTHKKDDTTYLEIADPTFLDFDEAEDTDLESDKGTVLNEGVGIHFHAEKRYSKPILSRNKYSTTIDFTTSTAYELVVVNTQGRILHTEHGFSNRVAINHRSFSGKRSAAGMHILKLRAEGNELAIPIMYQ